MYESEHPENDNPTGWINSDRGPLDTYESTADKQYLYSQLIYGAIIICCALAAAVMILQLPAIKCGV